MATQGRPLSPEFKRAIVLVKDYFDRTKGDVREQEGASAERAANALGVGIATVKRVMADSQRSPAWFIQEDSMRRGRPPRAMADSLQTITRDYVRQANERARISRLRWWLSICKRQVVIPISASAHWVVRSIDGALRLARERAPNT